MHAAGIPVGPTRESALNYTPAELDDLLDSFSDDDWQFAVHVNGDYALDVVLDSYQRELTRCALLGTDHRWRVKHVGSQWQRFAGAVDAGASVSFHNDGSVSPPIPLRNIQAAVTRHTFSGEEHGPEQRMSLDDALRAHTVVAAPHIRRPDLGSITHEARSLALRRFGRRDARRVDHRIAHPGVRRVARRDARVVTCRPDRPARVGVIRNL
ncbi:amidohydrolase family protein [Microbacterium lacticum]